ncbi:DUF7344 domain-containing protein [Haladaptatus sp. DFWS20]|uniref:DUF7344 domain-containing protein n=1 Tax=Haladaptatus sp. DFWS20 TaxID=3403467 RepID=UPI003EBE4A41
MERDDHPSVDEIFEVLTHPRRRLLLQYFKHNSNPIDLDDLATRVARWEQDPAAVPSEIEIDHVRTALHKTHLPQIDAVGLIDYDLDSHAIHYDQSRIRAAMENVVNVIEFLYTQQPDSK